MGKQTKAQSYKGKILIINDVPGIYGRIVRLLVQEGYHCTFVDSAHEANTLLEREYFDTTVYAHEFLPDHTKPELPSGIK
ncbi:MAG: hypothetical protein V3U31_08665 [Dehalococcoidia bacterium]